MGWSSFRRQSRRAPQKSRPPSKRDAARSTKRTAGEGLSTNISISRSMNGRRSTTSPKTSLSARRPPNPAKTNNATAATFRIGFPPWRILLLSGRQRCTPTAATTGTHRPESVAPINRTAVRTDSRRALPEEHLLAMPGQQFPRWFLPVHPRHPHLLTVEPVVGPPVRVVLTQALAHSELVVRGHRERNPILATSPGPRRTRTGPRASGSCPRR